MGTKKARSSARSGENGLVRRRLAELQQSTADMKMKQAAREYFGNYSRNRIPERVNDYETHLRGFSNNRYGGHKSQRLRTYGGLNRPAGACKTYTEEEKRQLEVDMGLRVTGGS